jgi:hypothetical protein
MKINNLRHEVLKKGLIKFSWGECRVFGVIDLKDIVKNLLLVHLIDGKI